MTDLALDVRRWPQRRPLAFLFAALLWALACRALVPLSERLVAALPVRRDSHLGDGLAYFFYDTPKVLLLLTGVVFVMGRVNSWFTPERTRALLAGRAEGVGNVMAASPGIVTPSCSCSAVPLAVLIGVPMYANAGGMIPVVEALLAKGAALGTVLAFMMSVIALSLPEMVILRRVLKLRLTATFVTVVAGGILVVGYAFNFVLG
jgi:uncharacterized membrane protein YraQ (UPF0718 family)